MLNQSLHLTLLNLIALQQRQATANLRSLAALFMLLLPALLAELLADCLRESLAEVAPEGTITVEARSNMLSLGLVSELLHHLIELLVIQLDLDFIAFGREHLNYRLILEVTRLPGTSTAIDCVAVEVLGNIVHQ